MKTLTTTSITTLTAALVLSACGAGAPADSTNSKTYPCDSNIVSIMATMSSPFVMGLGEPDTITYSKLGINHVMTYEFHALHERITFEYNTNYCSERVETGL